MVNPIYKIIAYTIMATVFACSSAAKDTNKKFNQQIKAATQVNGTPAVIPIASLPDSGNLLAYLYITSEGKQEERRTMDQPSEGLFELNMDLPDGSHAFRIEFYFAVDNASNPIPLISSRDSIVRTVSNGKIAEAIFFQPQDYANPMDNG